MRLLFWNVQRLGASTDDARRTILGQVLYARAPDHVALCELTTASTIPMHQNITYRHQNPWQLCYGFFDHNGTTQPLARVNPAAGVGYAGQFLGGNNFANLVDRALAHAGNIGGYEVYVIHSPAYQTGANRAITFLAHSLATLHGGINVGTPWMVVGDFNVEPHVTSAFVQGFILNSGATYIGGLPKAYDYVLTNRPGHVGVTTLIPSGPGSDHLAIEINY